MTQRSKTISTLPMHLSLSLMNYLICKGALQQQREKLPSSKPRSNASPARTKKNQSPLPLLNPNLLLGALSQLQQKQYPSLSQRHNQSQRQSQKQSSKPAPSLPFASAPLSAASSPLLHPDFAAALFHESEQRTLRMIEGVRQYQAFDIPPDSAPSRIIWRKANATLRDYGGSKNAPALLCVPSLINRASIFDLHSQRSFVRYMRAAGFRVLILDWDSPSSRERRYGMAEYVDYLLLEALAALRESHTGAVHLLGYCMGGLLAMAAAQCAPTPPQSLVLLATPWQRIENPALTESDWQRFEEFIRSQDSLHPAITQTLFHLLDPWHFQSKFARFTQLSAAEQKHFSYVEQWANDGVPLSRYVAQECYIRWPRDDLFAAGQWRVRGQAIHPKAIPCPSFVALPKRDRIVPLQSSSPLAKALPNAHRISPNCGHISMLVGDKAEQQLWRPLAAWLHQMS